MSILGVPRYSLPRELSFQALSLLVETKNVERPGLSPRMSSKSQKGNQCEIHAEKVQHGGRFKGHH